MWQGTFDATWTPSKWSLGATFESGKTGRTEIIDDAQFGKALRVHYDAGASDHGGAEFKGPLPGLPADAVCFSYWVRFDATFQWVKGGKLPGLCAGACFSGGNPSDGVSGWSMRYMWRAYGAGEEYGYILPAEPYGTELGLGTWTFGLGNWHHIEEQIILNDPGKSNGVARVWYDRSQAGERPVYEATNLVYRSVFSLVIDRIFFSTFFGGHDATWATPLATYIDFARFELFE